MGSLYMRVLLVEDDKALASSIRDRLKAFFVVDVVHNGTDGTYEAQINHYDVIVLDIGLPDIDGVEVCKMIRTAQVRTPVLMLTGTVATATKVASLDSGADDYLTKPFSYDELLARLRALLRRTSETVLSSKLKAGDLVLDVVSKTVHYKETSIYLRRKEFDLLECLMRNPNRVLTREVLLESVWHKSLEVESNTIEAHISTLRSRIEKPFGTTFIKTIHGIGYKLEVYH